MKTLKTIFNERLTAYDAFLLSLLDNMPEEQATRFREASNHPHECQCMMCQEWWQLMGPQ